MTKITKRVVDAAQVREKDYVIWDEELLGFGLRVFASGKRSYVINTGQPAARLATPSAPTGLDARDGTTGSECPVRPCRSRRQSCRRA